MVNVQPGGEIHILGHGFFAEPGAHAACFLRILEQLNLFTGIGSEEALQRIPAHWLFRRNGWLLSRADISGFFR